MHDGLDASQRVAKGGGVGQIPECDLDPHALVAEPVGVAHEATHQRTVRGKPPQQGRPDSARRPRQQDHGRRPTTTTRHGERSLRCSVTSAKPASSIQARISEGLKLRLWLQA